MPIYTVLGHRNRPVAIVEARSQKHAIWRAYGMLDQGDLDVGVQERDTLTVRKPTDEEYAQWNAGEDEDGEP